MNPSENALCDLNHLNWDTACPLKLTCLIINTSLVGKSLIMGSITLDRGIYLCLAFQCHSLTDASVGLMTPTQRRLLRCHCKQGIRILHVNDLKRKDSERIEWSQGSFMRRLLVRIKGRSVQWAYIVQWLLVNSELHTSRLLVHYF